MFELLDRDGYGRVGRFSTPHGPVETPVLLPVIHPAPTFQVIPPKEMYDQMGVRAVITSSYILHGRKDLQERALGEGLHGLLGFPGTIMTDSGAFQQHVYGDVGVGPAEILAYQDRIGSDILTPLDVFIEPETPREEAERGVEETIARVREARTAAGSKLLAVPVQGGLFPDLRERSARTLSGLADVLCVGGIVPLMEGYRFAELIRLLARLRPALPPEKPLHFFGLGHPMLFGLGVLLGGDIFDTSSYHKFARRGSLLFPEGSVDIGTVREDFCGCRLCAEVPLTRVRALPPADRERHLARHNLQQCLWEMARVRQAIREGELWEHVERRASSHPALLAALEELSAHKEVFLPVEPPSRRSFSVTGADSLNRPAIQNFRSKLALYVEGREQRRVEGFRGLLQPGPAEAREKRDSEYSDPALLEVQTPLGWVPVELTEVYPLGCLVSPAEFSPRQDRPRRVPDGVAVAEYPSPDTAEVETTPQGRAGPLALRHALGIVEWCWGRGARAELTKVEFSLRHSRSTGRLRDISRGGEVLFVVGNDGLPHPTLAGGELLHRWLPSPQGRVVASGDAAPFVLEGKSLYSRHVVGVDPSVVPDQYVLLVDPTDRFLGVGRTLLAGSEMGQFTRGVAVRVTAHRHDLTLGTGPQPPPPA